MNPYSVLGIPESATDDEVKKAYRTLSKKYHPDANINNPDIEALTEKFKQVQNAYDQIMDMRKHGTSYNSYGPQYQNNTTYNGQQYQYKQYTNFEDMFNDMFGGQYQQNQTYNTQDTDDYDVVRHFINSGAYDQALNVLNNMSDKTAGWYYYSAICNAYLGNMVRAKEDAETAVRMDPNNVEFRNLLAYIQSGRMRYQQRGTPYGFSINGMPCYMNPLMCCMFMVCGGSGCIPCLPFICCL